MLFDAEAAYRRGTQAYQDSFCNERRSLNDRPLLARTETVESGIRAGPATPPNSRRSLTSIWR